MKTVPSPNASWKPGDKIDPPFTSQQIIDPNEVAAGDMYRVLIGAVAPRPIALVSTVSTAGIFNVAPFSFFNAISSAPPCLALGISKRPDGTLKDSHQNMIDTGEFVVNIVNRWLLEPMVYSAGTFAPDVDEFAVTGLTPLPSHRINAPRVAESSINFECKLHRIVSLGENGSESNSTLLIGRIVLAHIDERAMTTTSPPRINTDLVDPVGRLGGIEYALLNEKCSMSVPTTSKSART